MGDIIREGKQRQSVEYYGLPYYIHRGWNNMPRAELLTKTRLSELVGWSESTGRSWIRQFDKYIPKVQKGNSVYFTQDSVRILSYIKKLNDLGYTKKGALKFFETYGVPKDDAELDIIIGGLASQGAIHEVPAQKEITIPFLKIMSDGRNYKSSEIIELLIAHFKLTEEQTSILYSNGRDYVFAQRVRAARYSLKNSNYIEEVSKSTYKITQEGLSLLSESIDEIEEEIKEINEIIDPYQIVEDKVSEIEQELADLIIEQLKKSHWRKLEKVVVKLLVAMGYGEGRETQPTNDGGIDGIIKEDKLGLDNIYVQAKCWQKPVGRDSLMSFSGALDAKGAKKGVFITTSHFTNGALEYVSRLESKKIVPINGTELASYMIEYGIGVKVKKEFVVKELDFDYFEEE